MEQVEFKIKSMPDYSFRPKTIRAIEINALATTIDLNDIEKTIKTYDFVLEHLEVKIQESWVQVKQKNDYWPANLEDDVIACQELVEWFLENIVFKAFQKSSE